MSIVDEELKKHTWTIIMILSKLVLEYWHWIEATLMRKYILQPSCAPKLFERARICDCCAIDINY